MAKVIRTNKEDARSNAAQTIVDLFKSDEFEMNLRFFFSEHDAHVSAVHCKKSEVYGGGIQHAGNGYKTLAWSVECDDKLTADQYQALKRYKEIDAEVSVKDNTWVFFYDPETY